MTLAAPQPDPGAGAPPRPLRAVFFDLDGTVFDSSIARGQPISFPLSGVIAGWTEGLQLMKVGDKFRFVIPANLAYGANSPPPIPPNSTLVFEVELLGIE